MRLTTKTLPLAGIAAPAPPFALPGIHFAATLLWLAVAAILLVALAPTLANGRPFEPAVFALVHVLVIGAIGSAIFGTLQQFVPAGLGVPLRSVRLGFWSFAALQCGVLSLVVGFWWWRGAPQAIGWLLVLSAMGGVSRNVLRARRYAVNGALVGLYITVAHSFLGAGMAIAFARIGETLGWWHVDRMALLAAHALFGAVGFGTLSAIGVGSRMVPTFFMGPGDDTRWMHWQLGLTSSGLVLFGVGAVLTSGTVMRAGAVVLLGGGILTVALPVRWVRRKRRPLDGALWHAVSSFVALGTSLPVGAWLLLGEAYAFERWAALMVILVVGWLITLVIGVMAKILPHLAYNTFARTRPGIGALGSPNAMLREDWQRASAVLMALGWSGLAASLLLRAPPAAQWAAIVWSAGIAVVLANYLRILAIGIRARSTAPLTMR